MKTIVKVLAITLLLVAFVPTQAQKATKIGHVNFGKILEVMPGQDTIKAAMEKYAKSLSDQLAAMNNELQMKKADYDANVATMSSIIKQTKEREMQDLYSRAEQFQISAREELSTKQEELVKPFLDKIKKAIGDVAKENGFAYVFNMVEDLILYSDGGEDVTNLVKKKLGIQ